MGRTVSVELWLPDPGDCFVVDSVSPRDSTPTHRAGDAFVCDASRARFAVAVQPHGVWVLLMNEAYPGSGREGSSGTYCKLRPATPEEEAACRLGGRNGA